MFYYVTSNGARVGDNVVFVTEPGNSFDHSCVKVGLSRDSCFWSSGGQSHIYYKSVRDSARKSRASAVYFCVLHNYYIIFVTSRRADNNAESQWKEEKWPPKMALSQMRSAFHASFTVRFVR